MRAEISGTDQQWARLVIKSPSKSRSASCSATFCHPEDCELASRACAVCGSSRALCHSSLWWPWAVMCTHYTIRREKFSGHCHQSKGCLMSLGCQVPHHTSCGMPSCSAHCGLSGSTGVSPASCWWQHECGKSAPGLVLLVSCFPRAWAAPLVCCEPTQGTAGQCFCAVPLDSPCLLTLSMARKCYIWLSPVKN